jgi:hypothetical protein
MLDRTTVGMELRSWGENDRMEAPFGVRELDALAGAQCTGARGLGA